MVDYSIIDWVGSPVGRKSTSGYCTLVGGNLVSLKSKEHNVVARSSAKAKYHDMVLATGELE